MCVATRGDHGHKQTGAIMGLNSHRGTKTLLRAAWFPQQLKSTFFPFGTYSSAYHAGYTKLLKSRIDVIISKMFISVHVTPKGSMPHLNIYHHTCFSRAWGIPVRLSSKYGCTNTKNYGRRTFMIKKLP